MTKTEILRKIADRIEENIAELKHSLEIYADDSNIDEGDTIDPEDFSRQSESKEMEMRMQLQLDQAAAQLSTLHDLEARDHTSVEAGALIETDKNWFFVGVSFPAVHLDQKEIIGISTESPAFGILRGKTAGDQFQLGQETFHIRAIY